MKLSEVIANIGDANVGAQRLTDCLVEAKTNSKGVTKVTFATKEIHTNDLMFGGEKGGKVCLIVWLPADRLKAVLSESRAEPKEGA